MTGGKLQKSTKTRSERDEQWIRFTHEAPQDGGVGKGTFPPTSGAGGEVQSSSTRGYAAQKDVCTVYFMHFRQLV